MTNFRKLTTGAAILSVTALMSTSAFAMDDDMTCGDFMELDEDAQMEMAMKVGPDGGREEAHDTATGEDATEEGVGVEMSTSADVEANDDAGQEGQRTEARGDDVMASMIEYCEDGPELMLSDMPAGDGMGQ